VLVDGGPWYPRALNTLGVPWVGKGDVRGAERGRAVEWFSVFKHRIKRFYRRWPYNARVETAASWSEAFVAVYNVRRA